MSTWRACASPSKTLSVTGQSSSSTRKIPTAHVSSSGHNKGGLLLAPDSCRTVGDAKTTVCDGFPGVRMMTARLLTIFAAAGLAVAASRPGRAQAGWVGAPVAYSSGQYAGGQYPGSIANPRRIGYDNGYRDGLMRGEQAVRARRPLDIERERDYRMARNGYDRGTGDPNRYSDNYRAGFAQGYREAYNRGMVGTSGRDYGRGYGRGDDQGYGRGYGQGYGRGNGQGYGRDAITVAFQNGERDGYLKGLDDVTHRRRPDFTRQGWYRSGDRDYNGRYGSRDGYRNEYRRGFEEGYRRGSGERPPEGRRGLVLPVLTVRLVPA